MGNAIHTNNKKELRDHIWNELKKQTQMFSSGTENKLKKALLVSFECHKDQKRKGADFPYYVHILDVVKYLMYETKDADVIAAGALHDTLEDSNYTKEELKENFGEKIFDLVNFCTEPGNTPDASKEDQVKSWKKRKQHSIDSLDTASKDKLLVYVADKLSNITSMQEDIICGVDIWSRFNAEMNDIEWYYFSIVKRVEPKLKDTRLFKIFRSRVKEVFNLETI